MNVEIKRKIDGVVNIYHLEEDTNMHTDINGLEVYSKNSVKKFKKYVLKNEHNLIGIFANDLYDMTYHIKKTKEMLENNPVELFEKQDTYSILTSIDTDEKHKPFYTHNDKKHGYDYFCPLALFSNKEAFFHYYKNKGSICCKDEDVTKYDKEPFEYHNGDPFIYSEYIRPNWIRHQYVPVLVKESKPNTSLYDDKTLNTVLYNISKLTMHNWLINKGFETSKEYIGVDYKNYNNGSIRVCVKYNFPKDEKNTIINEITIIAYDSIITHFIDCYKNTFYEFQLKIGELLNEQEAKEYENRIKKDIGSVYDNRLLLHLDKIEVINWLKRIGFEKVEPVFSYQMNEMYCNTENNVIILFMYSKKYYNGIEEFRIISENALKVEHGEHIIFKEFKTMVLDILKNKTNPEVVKNNEFFLLNKNLEKINNNLEKILFYTKNIGKKML